MKHDLRTVAAHFEISGSFVSAVPYGSGHINDTYLGTYDSNGDTIRYIHQRVNHDVFNDPASLMHNVARVTAHQHRKLTEAGVGDTARRALTLIRTAAGDDWHQDADGNTWRTYKFIENASTYDSLETPNQAFEAARAFGEFQKQVADLPGRLHETIPGFHDTPKRFEALLEAIENDPLNRAAEVKPEIDFAMQHRNIVSILLDEHRAGAIPERVTHNDTKINNVMLDDETGEGVCVIDLDTVMPGLALYDFGDMVRSSTPSIAEDEPNSAGARMQMHVFEELVKGYLSSAESILTDTERHYMPLGGKLMTFECGIRFLADYIAGDIYFKIHSPLHNLHRTRTQFRLIQSMEEQEAAMQAVVDGF